MERTLSEGGESRLSLLLACQYLGQLPAGLRESALTNANLKCFFRLGPEDVKLVDRAVGAGWGARAAGLDPQPVPGWDQLGGRLRADEWESLPDRRRAGIKVAIGRALPPLDKAEGNWGKRSARRDNQGRDDRIVNRLEAEGRSGTPTSWDDDGIS